MHNARSTTPGDNNDAIVEAAWAGGVLVQHRGPASSVPTVAPGRPGLPCCGFLDFFLARSVGARQGQATQLSLARSFRGTC